MCAQTIDVTDYLNAPVQEAFRVLSANLALKSKAERWKTISICSFNPGEGKTAVAFNLAIIAAKSGSKVLLVDGDLRKPNHLKRHGDENIIGLTNYDATMKLEDIVCATGVENLTYVAAGNKLIDPIEFLSGNDYGTFLKTAVQKYDIVFVDSPAIGNYIDAAVIGSKVSGVLVVVKAQKTKYQNIDRIKWHMGNANANIIGIVLNKVDKVDFRAYFNLHNNYKSLAKHINKMQPKD
ncbi:MAG: CpsD/CapB family tyrosine-protein kinase [Peptococcaceae bacterium]|nr:CpsD/CapB family tyrosine-protein kinase [Peptococcaceae bacterium]